MKYWLIITFVFSYVCLNAQSPGSEGPGTISIFKQEVCWSYNGTDSTLVGYYLYSQRRDTSKLLSYVNASGQKVDVSAGGEITVGPCCCATSSNSVRADNLFVSEMCWNDGAAYQSINRVILTTTTSTSPLIILYRDADGNYVDVQEGDSLYYGYCDCCVNNPN
jgi:hypothetical protein